MSSKRATVVGDDIDFRTKVQISDASNYRKKLRSRRLVDSDDEDSDDEEEQ